MRVLPQRRSLPAMKNPLVMLRTACAPRSALQRITADGVSDVQRAVRRVHAGRFR